MSSEIPPLYAVVDKSRKENRDELTVSDAAVSDVIESDEDAPKIPPRRLDDLQDAVSLLPVASQSDAISLTIGASAESDLSVPPLPAKKNPPPFSSLYELVEDRCVSKNPEPPSPAELLNSAGSHLPAKNTQVKKNPSPFSLYELVDGFRDRSVSRSVEISSPATEQLGTTEVLSKTKDDGDKPSARPCKYQIMLCLAVTVMGVLFLTILAALLIVIMLGLKSDIAALQAELSIFQQNISYTSEYDRSDIDAISVDLISQELMELRYNYLQLLNTIHRSHEEVSQNNTQLYVKLQLQDQESSENNSLLYSEVLQLRSELECAFITTSCSDLPSSCPSGYYLTRNSSAVRVYCDMTLSCGNITGGWMRVAKLNMTDTSQQCPGELVERKEAGIRQCRIPGNVCFSVYHSTADVSYSRVCGRITAYQIGSTNAFRDFYRNLATDLDSNYVAGVSLTHGTSPRKHIWTFAAALDRNDNVMGPRNSHCPCRFDVNPFEPPPFVGEDYFCDAGNEEYMEDDSGLQTDPLWDRTDCLCCVSDNPPWFYKQLPQPTTDDIEMRVCKEEDSENIAITEVEIYVQ